MKIFKYALLLSIPFYGLCPQSISMQIVADTSKPRSKVQKSPINQRLLPRALQKATILPEDYHHQFVQAQIQRYRDIYKDLYMDPKNHANNGPNLFRTAHVAGLMSVLNDGFSLISDYINQDFAARQDRMDEGTTPEVMGATLTYLKKLHHLAVDLHRAEKMTQEYFIYINLILTNIVDFYKQSLLDKGDKAIIKRAKDYIFYGLKGLSYALDPNKTKKEVKKYLNVIRPIEDWPKTGVAMVIYGNPDAQKSTAIGMKTFVDQALHDDYKGCLLLFDIKSMPTDTGTKKDPHYSKFNGTYYMFMHDLSHIIEQTFYIENNFLDGSEFGSKLKDVKKIADNLYATGNYHDAHILINGLFLLSHEFFNISRFGLGSTDQPHNINNLYSIIDFVMKQMMFSTQGSRGGVYKVDYRDHERILSVRDKNTNHLASLLDASGTPFIPDNFSTLKPEDKQTTIEDAYHRYWLTFKKIMRDNGYGEKYKGK